MSSEVCSALQRHAAKMIRSREGGVQRQRARRSERRGQHELSRGRGHVEGVHAKRLSRNAQHANSRLPRDAAHHRENPREHVRVAMAVEMRHRDPRLAHPLDLCAELRRELVRIDAPGQRAAPQLSQPMELARSRIDERRNAQQRPPLHQIQMHTDIERARRAREAHRVLPVDAVRHHRGGRHGPRGVRLDDPARHAVRKPEVVGVDDEARAVRRSGPASRCAGCAADRGSSGMHPPRSAPSSAPRRTGRRRPSARA